MRNLSPTVGAVVDKISKIDFAHRNMVKLTLWRIALLSQEGSVIAFFAMTRGVVPQTKGLGMHS